MSWLIITVLMLFLVSFEFNDSRWRHGILHGMVDGVLVSLLVVMVIIYIGR